MYTLSVGDAVCSYEIQLHFDAFFADNAIVCFVPDLYNRPIVGLFSLTWRAHPQKNELVRRCYSIARRTISSCMLFSGYSRVVLSPHSEQTVL